ncbi:MAG: cardiolipin synthase [Acetilactobacillus jinshanensis]
MIKIIIIVNAGLAIITVFRSKRDIAATWAWLLVLIFLPLIGFGVYAFVGRKLPEKKIFRLQARSAIKLDHLLVRQTHHLNNAKKVKADDVTYKDRSLVRTFRNADMSFLARKNRVEIFTDGHQLFDRMIKDIQGAKSSVNIEFYTFYNDHLGRKIRDLLVKKARAGVQVRVVYDSLGSIGTHKRFFKPLLKAGGLAMPFLHTHSAIFDVRLNFRDHRKIVVIDGQVGYVGGFNIGDQYLGENPKYGYWRDTHLRILGSGVFSLQAQFILDWNVTDSYHPINDETRKVNYFPLNSVDGSTNMQIVSSGPDTDKQQIKYGYIKMIQMAQNRCWIQTPYLIPDDSVMDALRMAVMSGVDVRIMMPCKPDHPFVYRATQYYADWLAHEGVKIYYYENGFMHAKTVVIDDGLSSVGSANFDFRSFKLNFEINAFIYDKKINQQLTDIYAHDIRHCQLQTPKMFDKQPYWLVLKQRASRLLSPIL